MRKANNGRAPDVCQTIPSPVPEIIGLM